jgi:glycosyltransferase involved in cell wall biosynthesis
MTICSPQYGLSSTSPAGGEVYDEKILKGLADKGVNIEIILPYGKPYDTTQKNWNVHHLSLPLIHHSYFFNLAIISSLISIHKKTNFKVLRIHSPYYVGIGAWIFKKLFAPDIRLITTYFHFEDKLIFRLIDKIFIKRWDHIITISQATKKVLVEKYRILEEKITIAYPGISKEYISKPKSKEVLKKYDLLDKFVVSFCGMLIKRKNVKFLIDLIKLLSSQNVSFLIIGDGPEHKSLENYASKKGVTSKMVFTGFLSEKDKIAAIQSSDIFVFPSLMEGFGLSPIEAMACGIPTIVSNRGSLPEVVENGGIILSLNVRSWANMIEKLIASSQLRNGWAYKAQKRAHNFNWTEAINETYDMLCKL